MHILKDNYLFFLLSVFIIFVDQLTKYIAVIFYTELVHGIEIFSFLNLVFVTNKGISFGLLSNLNISFFLGLISLAISMVLIFWLTKSSKAYEKFTLSLILGGALGNGIDRIYQSYVIDFIDFHYKGYHWPAFNVADTFITLGVIIYIIYNLNEALFLKK